MAEQLKYAGVPVYMNGRNYYIPSLSTRDFRANYEALTQGDAQQPIDALTTISKFVPIVGLAIRRNYPDVTNEQLEDWLDLHTFRLAVQAVQDASGMEPVTVTGE